MGKGLKAWSYARRAVAAFGGGVAARSVLAASLFAASFAVSGSNEHRASAQSNDSRVSLSDKVPPKGTRMYVVANRITYDSRSKVATADGMVQINYGQYTLVATRVTYDTAKDIFTANGEVRMKEPGGNILEADRVQLQNRFRDGFAEHLRLLLTNDATITADYATRRDGYITIYEHVTYVRCKTCVLSDGTPLWQLKSRETKHDEREGVLYHKDATFEFAGTPLITLPEFSQPDPTVKRRTGFLMPNLSYESLYGVGVTVPYFINLAPNYDVTLLPMVTTGQGVLAHAEWRHRLENGEYNIDAAGIYQLDPKEPDPDEPNDPDQNRWRGSIRSEGEFELNRYWTWGWDGTLTSDDTFRHRYLNDGRDEAMSQVYLAGIHDRNYFSAQVLHFRTLDPSDDQDTFPYALPYVQQSITLDQPIFGGEFGFDYSVYSLHRNEEVFGLTEPIPIEDLNLGKDQTRGSLTFRWQRQIINDFGQVITPFTNVRGDLYVTNDLPALDDEDDLQSDTVARVMPTAGLDARWPFISSSSWGQHILTPVAQVISSTNEEDEDLIGNEDAIELNFSTSNLFLQDRFSGLDRYEGGTRANTGVLYTYLAPNGGSLRFSLGESFHLAGENSFATDTGLAGTRSDIVTAIALQPWENLRFTYQARVDEDLSDVNAQETGVSLNLDRFAASLYYANLDAEPTAGRPDKEQQIWGNASWNFYGGWSLFGAARYDLEEGRILRDAIGFAYDCDCFSFKVYYSEDKTGDEEFRTGRSVIFSIDLKSLGGSQVAPEL